MEKLAKISTTDVQLESSFKRVSPLEMHKTDHCERICRRPGGRVVIRRLSLTESNLADFIEGVSRSSVLNNNVSFAVELKSPVHTERLFAVVGKIPDGIVNECTDSVDAFERTVDLEDALLPTPDYSSPSSETEDTESFESLGRNGNDDTFDSNIMTPEPDYVEELPVEVISPLSMT
jgi:hypothetical protein